MEPSFKSPQARDINVRISYIQADDRAEDMLFQSTAGIMKTAVAAPSSIRAMPMHS
jgi:hypothetical protein